MTKVCNFCLKFSEACKSVDEILRETIQIVFINVELVIAQYSLICKECIQRLHLALDLKTASICNENLIVSYETNKPRPEKLIDFYLKKNKMDPDVFPYELKICRFCITVVTENLIYLLEDTVINMNIREIVTKYLPEVDFTITNNPVVCKKCLKNLQGYGIFINSWLDVYNLKKSYCFDNNTVNPDLNEVRKFIFETKKGRQHSDNYEIYTDDIKKENITRMFEIGANGNAKNSHCLVDNIQLKDDIEIHELKLQYPAEGEPIKTEIVSSDVQIKNDDLTMDYDFEMVESKLKTEILQSETKIESDDHFLKEEISVSNVMDAVDSTEVEEYSERNSNARSLCNRNQEIEQQKSNEYSCLSEHEVPIEVNNDGQIASSFFRKTFPKKEQNLRSLTKKSVSPLMVSSNSAYHQPIKINNGFKNNLCQFQNQSEAQVEVHFEKHFNDFLLYKCDHCHYKSKNKRLLKSHLIVHSNENVFYECEHCDHKTKRKSDLKHHLIMHSDDNVFHKCQHCDFKTKYKKGLKSHLLLHSDGNAFYKCEHCDYKTKYKHDLKRHLKVHLGENRVYKCKHCDYKTKHKGDLKYHVIMHSDDFVFHKCEHCDFKTKHKNSLKSHLILHSDENVFYKCEHCDYKAKRKSDLRSHLIMHSHGNVFHKCEHCDFKTKYKNSLRSHLVVHSHVNVFYKCEHCDFKTKYKNSLKSHFILHSDENVFYKCDHCDFQTKYKASLKNHLVVHSHENVFYKCEHCDYKTKYKYALKRHLIVHLNENVFYKCEHCDFKTKYKSCLKSHLILHSDVFHKCE